MEEEEQRKKLEEFDEQLKKIEEKNKLSFFEKFALKRMSKKVRNSKLKNIDKNDKKSKDQLIDAILETTKVFDIVDQDTGYPVDLESLRKKSIEELMVLLEDILIEFEKEI